MKKKKKVKKSVVFNYHWIFLLDSGKTNPLKTSAIGYSSSLPLPHPISFFFFLSTSSDSITCLSSFLGSPHWFLVNHSHTLFVTLGYSIKIQDLGIWKKTPPLLNQNLLRISFFCGFFWSISIVTEFLVWVLGFCPLILLWIGC